ncbi:MAG TPA: glycerophosphodiester phosphodiesterase [Bryobacteraceae bacterium]|jgi:glycerophosphoryl diester phosphodiesterase|nr:glycerophosphodiester phosphodiesterase [Bryobacteraceae bacterium]
MFFRITRALLFSALCLMTANSAPRILVHGHRGARAIYPENTIPAFQYAIKIGADFLEMDVAVTKDNVLVISHDPHINPEICKGPHPGIAIHELTVAQLREYDCGALKNPHFPKQQPVPGTRIPTLDEVLSLSSGNNVQFNIETKSFPDHPELTPAPDVFSGMLLDVIRKHKLESRSIVQSFDFRTLHATKHLEPHIRLSALWEGDARPFVDIAREGEAEIVSPLFKLVTPQQVKASHQAKIQVVPWTADSPADWQMLIDAGVDAIITDDPAALIGYLKDKGLR